MRKILFVLCISSALSAVSVIPLEPIEAPKGASVAIDSALDGSNIIRFPINIKVKIQGFLLGAITQQARKNQFRGNPLGQTVHLFIDNEPYVALTKVPSAPFINYEIKSPLPRGEHLVRVLMCYSFGESLKGSQTFDDAVFSVSDRKDKMPLEFDRHGPLLTYNEPQGTYDKGDILLDFYLTGCTLSSSGYKVRLNIDGQRVKMLEAWVPYSITGLSKGPHKVRLTLIDPTGHEVDGEFNDVEREIFVK